MFGHEICGPGRKCSDQDRPTHERPKFVRTELKKSQKMFRELGGGKKGFKRRIYAIAIKYRDIGGPGTERF